MTARHILVMGNHTGAGDYYTNELEEAGYRVTYTTEQSKAALLLRGDTQFDLVLSGAYRWESYYLQAIAKFGNEKVVVYSILVEVVKELRAKGIQAFYKDDLDHHEFSRTWSQLLIEIKILIPI